MGLIFFFFKWEIIAYIFIFQKLKSLEKLIRLGLIDLLAGWNQATKTNRHNSKTRNRIRIKIKSVHKTTGLTQLEKGVNRSISLFYKNLLFERDLCLGFRTRARIMASSKTIILRSSEGEDFGLHVVAAMELLVIKPIIEEGNTKRAIPLPNVTSKILAKVIEYCKKHVETPKAEEHAVNDELKGWAADFFKDDRATFFDLIKVLWILGELPDS